MLVKEQYRNLDRDGLIQKAYDLGSDFEKKSGSCSQSLVAGLNELIGLDDTIVRCSSSSCAGLAGSGIGPCGALAGGIMVLDYFFGREGKDMSFTEKNPDCMVPLMDGLAITYGYHTKFIQEFGTAMCAQIQMKRYGRSYFLRDADEAAKFDEAGAHDLDDKCGDIVGIGARMVMEILLDQGVIEVA